MVDTALGEELSDHLGYDKHDPVGRDGGNSRNSYRTETVLTEVGPMQIEVPRDRDGTFEPAIVRKRARRLDGIDQIVLSLAARGLTTGEVAAHFAEIYGAKVSKDTISQITDKVVEEMTEWRNRPLDLSYTPSDIGAQASSAVPGMSCGMLCPGPICQTGCQLLACLGQ